MPAPVHTVHDFLRDLSFPGPVPFHTYCERSRDDQADLLTGEPLQAVQKCPAPLLTHIAGVVDHIMSGRKSRVGALFHHSEHLIVVALHFLGTKEFLPDAVRADPDYLLFQAGILIFPVFLFHVLAGQIAFPGSGQPCQHKKRSFMILHSDNTSL